MCILLLRVKRKKDGMKSFTNGEGIGVNSGLITLTNFLLLNRELKDEFRTKTA